MWSHGPAGAAADGRMWSHIALPVHGRTLAGRPKPGPGANGERTVFGRWVETHEDALFLPAASIVEIKAAIKSIPASRAIRADALDKRLDGLVATLATLSIPSTSKSRRARAKSCALKRRPPEVDKGQANLFDRSPSENGFIESFNARLPPSTAARLQRV